MNRILSDSLDVSSFKQRYEMVAEVGSGSFSSVWKTRNKETGTVMATKIINKRCEAARFMIQNEYTALRILKHPNIVQLYSTYEDDQNVYMVLEYVAGVNVTERLEKQGRFRRVDACKVFRGVLSAVEYMHELGFAHRDLKGDNIMLDSRGNAKLIDFGFCGRVSFVKGEKAEIVGSKAFKAPELLVEGGEESVGDRRKADVWSLGCVLYEMLLRRHPFVEGRLMVDLVLNAEFVLPTYLTPSAREMLSALLMLNPEERLTCTQAFSHRWVLINTKTLEEREAKEKLKEAKTTEERPEEACNADTTGLERNTEPSNEEEPVKVEHQVETTVVSPVEQLKIGKKKGVFSRLRAFFKKSS